MGTKMEITVKQYNDAATKITETFNRAFKVALNRIDGEVTDEKMIKLLYERRNWIYDDLRFFMSYQNIKHPRRYRLSEFSTEEGLDEQYIERILELETEIGETIKKSKTVESLKHKFTNIAHEYIVLYYNNITIKEEET